MLGPFVDLWTVHESALLLSLIEEMVCLAGGNGGMLGR